MPVVRSRSKPAGKPTPKNSSPVPRLNLWHGLFFVLGVGVALLAVIFAPHIGLGSLVSKSLTAVQRPSSIPAWGNLEYTTIDLERPDESFSATPPEPQPIIWNFPNLSEAELQTLLRQSELTAEEQRVLADKTRWSATSNGWQVRPSMEVVRDLSLSARKTLYTVLRKDPENFFLHNPARIPASKFEAWLAACGLPKDKQELVRKLCIPEGDEMCFYDSQVMEWICSPAEQKSLAKAIAQTPALLMRLHITPDTDMESLVNYWGRGSRAQAMKPFLQSLTRVPGGTSISVSFFFPTFARMRLYTYPDNQNGRLLYREDCFWTAMNFFNETPESRFYDPAQIQLTLKTEYTQVNTDWVFGDVIMLVGNKKQAIHMCVYVADGVVFTKNGAAVTAPWTLMKLPEMLKQYRSEDQLAVRVYRKKTV